MLRLYSLLCGDEKMTSYFIFKVPCGHTALHGCSGTCTSFTNSPGGVEHVHLVVVVGGFFPFRK